MALINSPPVAGALVDDRAIAVPGFATWLLQAFRILFDLQNSGTTAQRPTVNLYQFKFYGDTTLGIPIWYINGAWRNSAGVPV